MKYTFILIAIFFAACSSDSRTTVAPVASTFPAFPGIEGRTFHTIEANPTSISYAHFATGIITFTAGTTSGFHPGTGTYFARITEDTSSANTGCYIFDIYKSGTDTIISKGCYIGVRRDSARHRSYYWMELTPSPKSVLPAGDMIDSI